MNRKTKTTLQVVGLRPVARRFLVIFLLLAVILAGIMAMVYYLELRNDRAIVESNELQHQYHQVGMIESEFHRTISDLMFLSGQNEIMEMFEGDQASWREALAEEYLSFAAIKGLYDQIRFLDELGMEVVRVNFNNGSPSIVLDEQLQSKAKRYYFEDTFVLE